MDLLVESKRLETTPSRNPSGEPPRVSLPKVSKSWKDPSLPEALVLFQIFETSQGDEPGRRVFPLHRRGSGLC